MRKNDDRQNVPPFIPPQKDYFSQNDRLSWDDAALRQEAAQSRVWLERELTPSITAAARIVQLIVDLFWRPSAPGEARGWNKINDHWNKSALWRAALFISVKRTSNIFGIRRSIFRNFALIKA